MYSIISLVNSANDFEKIFREALKKIDERLKLFNDEELYFTVSEDVNNPGNFNIIAPVDTKSLKWLKRVAKKMNICISADVTSYEDELIFIPTLQFYPANGELVTLNIADFGCTNIELVYDKKKIEFAFYSSNYILFRNLRDISSYAYSQMDNSGFSNDINMFIRKYEAKSDYQEDDKNVIIKTLKGITETIDTRFFNKDLTAKEKSIQELSNQLKDIMFDMKNGLK
ncbi:hypothetical protein ABEX78_21295 [Priestia megaterium]